jgi:hypothetical protein
LLEPDAGKLASPVPRGARRRKAPGLPDGRERQRGPILTIASTIQATSPGRSRPTETTRWRSGVAGGAVNVTAAARFSRDPVAAG